jgi:hypothetical protein
MAYNIKKYNGSQLTVVADGTLDSTLSLKLVGKNYAGYGEAQNENFVYLLENFANASSPSNPINGQLWFDSSSNRLRFYDAANHWRTTGGADISASRPTWLPEGEFWFDTLNRQLWVWSLTGLAGNHPGFVLVGPQSVGSTTVTEMFSTSVYDSVGNAHPVIEAIVNGQVTFIISSDPQFTLSPTSSFVEGFTVIYPGMTMHNANTSSTALINPDTRLHGTSTNSDALGGFAFNHFATADAPTFTNRSTFSAAGYAIGTTFTAFATDNNNTTTIFKNTAAANGLIKFQTMTGTTTNTPVVIDGVNLLPGATNTTSLGNSAFVFLNLYASTVHTPSIVSTTGTTGIVTVDSNLTVTGNLIVSGDSTTINTATLSVEDPLVFLANNNALNLSDIGFVGQFGNASVLTYTGLVRDATDSVWKLFDNATTLPTTTVDFTTPTTYAALTVGPFIATTGTFSGALVATTGTFSGALVATTGTFSGATTIGAAVPGTGANLTVHGSISASNIGTNAGGAKTKGTGAPTGTGADGDIYYRYI